MPRPRDRDDWYYRSGQGAFLAWCRARGLNRLPPLPEVARYLDEVGRERGWSLRTRYFYRSAIGALYRDRGVAFDVKLVPLPRLRQPWRRS